MWFRFVCLFTLASATAAAVETDIKLERSDAQVVLFASEHNGWKPLPMTKNESGIWHIQLELERCRVLTALLARVEHPAML